MDISYLLDPLNDVQREAVAAPPGHLLVVAGAGSGKTRVLTHRMAYLIETGEVSPHGLLAVTFTNKAASEMRARIEKLIGISTRGMWVGTFHGLAHRLLRAHWREAGLPEGFQILDSEDQYRVVRRVLKQLGLDEGRWAPRQVQWYINSNKDEGLRSANLDSGSDEYQYQLQRIYRTYEEYCERAGLVDFAEIILRTLEMLKREHSLLEHYRRRFRHILVDEFQDTNAIQYAWLKLLTDGSNYIVSVGDDDQSIYGWRGARIENIQRFTDDFPGARILRLEQNYRSTGTILKAANRLIDHNQGRLGKELWTAGEEGDPILLYTAFNEVDEARFVVEAIRERHRAGQDRREMAVLYRSNAQSRVLEEALLSAGVPYRVYGGLRFFERQEIKDALAYLRLVTNRDDDAAFERVVNRPTRGIGERSLQAIRDRARQDDSTLWRAARNLVVDGQLPARAAGAVTGFLRLVEDLAAGTAGLLLHEKVDHVIEASGLMEMYRRERGEKAEMRVENLEELVTAARQFVNEDEHMDELPAFLSHAALEAGEGQSGEWEDCVQLMTLHSAKGLEFPVVFICGLEEGLFPHQHSMDEPGRLEEERRLFYVGMTRAMSQLYLTHAECRRLHGSETYTRPSRFLAELPEDCLHEVRLRASVTRPVTARPARPVAARSTAGDSAPGLRLGQRVQHEKFGEGVVMNYEGEGRHARVQVNFEAVGNKWLVMEYANLQGL